MTGDFDEKVRKEEKLAQQIESSRNMSPTKIFDAVLEAEQDREKLAGPQSKFFNKLKTLTDKINLFKTQFYKRQPRQQLNYDHVLSDKKLNFKTFKQIYSNSGEEGIYTF